MARKMTYAVRLAGGEWGRTNNALQFWCRCDRLAYICRHRAEDIPRIH